jgi:hypothetical protein
MLSKFWMPLDEFTGLTVEGLRKGDDYITVGSATQHFENFEKGKPEVMQRLDALVKKAVADSGKS